ncbi:DUF5685 family protein [Nakamurella panacisegetis]|uniref:DUF5685 family protein n=1 Tax=Nakamurella panacisegetis TaxID=1090615 RepID=UPI000B81F6D8|nr:DUF5685 family protein [Nakamurella panacisegetis]
MFGLIAPSRHQLQDELLEQWRAHLCGLCLSLRDHHGQLARTTTNTDAVLTSVLLQAQRVTPARTTSAGPCPLRGMRSATVIAADELSARFAGTASLTLAAAKLADLAGEQTAGLAPSRPLVGPVARKAAGRLRRRAMADLTMADSIDSRGMLLALSRQTEIETAVRPGDSLIAVTQPSADAAAAIFAATARLAGVPQNAGVLREMGHAYGRMAHLIDAVEDQRADVRAGAFNPLTATGRSVPEAKALCHRLSRDIRRGLDRLELADGRLLRVLLVDVVHSALHRVFDPATTAPAGRARHTAASTPTPTPTPDPPDPNGGGGGGRSVWRSVAPWVAIYCTGYALCAGHVNPCTGRRHDAGCSNCDCGDCGDCCNCADGDCCSCDCCDCNC